jgi:TPR repeat protein
MHINSTILLSMLLAALSLSIAATAHADPIEMGVTAYVAKDYQEAKRLVEPLANEGNPHAQAMMGDLYWHGRGVSQSYSESRYWTQKAADQGHLDSVANLAEYYEKGIGGVDKNMAEAVRLLRLAAKHESQYAKDELKRLGYPLKAPEKPKAVKPKPKRTAQQGFNALDVGNYRAAKQILEPYALDGHGDAQNVMGILYLDALGVNRDDEKAAEWFYKAARQGHMGGQYHYGYMIYYQHIARGVNPFETAQDYLKKSSQQGYEPATKLLATMEENERLRRIREKKAYDDSIDDIQMGRCRNPRYVTIQGGQRLLCD